MHHCIRNFDASRESIDQNAPGLAFEQRHELTCEGTVLLSKMKRCCQLAIQVPCDGEEFIRVAAFDQQSRGTKNFLQQIRGLDKMSCLRREELRLSCKGARRWHRASRHSPHSAVSGPVIRSLAIRSMN